MERPRVRDWIEALPITHEGRQMFYLRDTEGIVERSLIVSRDILFLVSLMDGSRTTSDLQEEYTRAVGTLIQSEQIQEIVDAMEDNCFLQSPRFETYLTELRRAYESAPCRQPFLSGKSYPDKADELTAFLCELFPKSDTPAFSGEIKGILAPHIDYQRGAKVYADVYRYLPLVRRSLIVIFGTCHHMAPGLWNISLKDFSTPLGTLSVPPELAALVKAHPLLSRSIAEWPHRQEHSIELQLPILQHFMTDRSVRILPILTGSMHEYVAGRKPLNGEELVALSDALREVLAAHGEPYVVIAGADLAHIGAQFGDSYPLSRPTLDQSRTQDELILESVRSVSADRFLRTVRDEHDRRRICGLAPIYFQLSLLEGTSATIVGYDQWSDGKSSVSFAGALFHD